MLNHRITCIYYADIDEIQEFHPFANPISVLAVIAKFSFTCEDIIVTLGSLRYGHHRLRTTPGRETPSHASIGPTALKGREDWTDV